MFYNLSVLYKEKDISIHICGSVSMACKDVCNILIVVIILNSKSAIPILFTGTSFTNIRIALKSLYLYISPIWHSFFFFGSRGICIHFLSLSERNRLNCGERAKC